MARKQNRTLDFQNVAKIVNLPAGADPGDPVTFEQLAAAIEGLRNKDPVEVKTTGNLDLSSPGTTIASVDMAAAPNKRFLATVQTDPTENGIYFWNGAAVPATRTADASTAEELNNALVPVVAGAAAGTTWRQTALLTDIDTDPQTWAQFGVTAVAATESAAGIAEIATQGETDTGTDDTRFITPLKLANYSGRAKRYNNVFGDGSATQFTFTHNLETRSVVVEVFENAGNYPTIEVDVERTSANQVRVTFEAGLAPGNSACGVVILA